MPSGSSANLHPEQIKAGLASSSSLAATAEPTSKPRVSEGAISIEAKQGKSMDGRSGPGHGSRPSSEALLGSAGLPHKTIKASAANPEKGRMSATAGMLWCRLWALSGQMSQCDHIAHPRSLSQIINLFERHCLHYQCTSQHAGVEHKHVTKEEHRITTTRFYGRSNPDGQSAILQPKSSDPWAVLRLALFIASFGFYLFTRSTTMDAKGRVTLFLYQLAVILGECLFFLSGCLIGLWQVSYYI